MSKKIFLVAGEPSGDLHASSLAAEIKKADPDISLSGIGGANMASAGVSLFHRTDELAIIGLQDILKHFWKIKEIFFSFIAKVEEEKADLVILIDYPGFNLRMAKELKKRGIKVIYYVSPQVWVWGSDRIETIRNCVEKILVFFKFEEDLYKRNGVPVEFVGHPLLDTAKPSAAKSAIIEKLRLDNAKKTVIILPGSRKREVSALLPTMVKASQKLYEKNKSIQFIVVRSQTLDKNIFEKCLSLLKAPCLLVENTGNDLYDYLAASDLAIAASGTVTLECAIMNVPMVITYKVSPISAIVMRAFMRISMIGLANILAGKKIVPELVQSDFTVGNVLREASKILFEEGVSSRIKKELAGVKESLGKEGASRRAALSVLNSLN
ncbi:MAG: lipid-A-disaccharide synthase [Candidatus Omnitrophica bacterium]|nr:lipid-A-disaccharide synthase [Candidatus Omnitrophota bacterium]